MIRRRLGVLVAALFLCVLPGAPADAAEPDGLVSHWRADGDPSDALGANDGAHVGNVVYAPGAVGQAFSFDGASFVDVANPTFNDHAGAFTVAAWISMTSYAEPAPVFNHRTAANDMGFTLEQLFGQPGTMTFAINLTGTAEDFQVVSAPGWDLGRLYHVAATFDSFRGTMVLYRDGRPVASRRDLPRIPMATKAAPQCQIGHNIRATAAFWRGLIDDVRLYGRALSPAEIASVASDRRPVAHWRFDELAGPVARDSAGTFPGTLTGGAAFVPGGISGNAVSLVETTGSFVDMGPTAPGFTSGDFSVVAWVKTTTTEIDSLVVAKHEGRVTSGYLLIVGETGGGGAPGRATFYASDPFVSQSPTSATTVNDGEWHQIVGVHVAGLGDTVFVDGAPGEATTATQAIVATTAPFVIGGVKIDGAVEPRYTGLVDDVQLYDRALTASEIDYLFAHPGREAPDLTYDLVADWSDTANPNGAWTYREGTNALPRVTNWGAAFGEFTSPKGAWARTEGGNTYLPAWFKETGTYTPAHDFVTGDVVVHTTDDMNGVGSGLANVAWTSPFEGVVDVSGAVWMGREIGRSNDWFVYRNGTLLTQGAIANGDAYDRAHPFQLAAGSGGAGALRDVAVVPGDVLRLEFAKTSVFGDLVGTNLTVSLPGRDETRITGFVLPGKVKLKLKGAGKDTFQASGSVDDGGAASVGWTQPLLLQIGGFSREVSLSPKGAGFQFKDATLQVTVTPNLKGTSRGTFAVKIAKATLGGLVAPAGPVEIRLGTRDLPDIGAEVVLANGAFALGAVRDAVAAPAFAPSKAKVVANATKPDVVTFGGAFAAAAPATLRDVHIALGDQFSLAIPGSAFRRTGDAFKNTTKQAGVAYSVTLDFARGLLTVKAKGVEAGAFANPVTDFLVDLGTGEPPVRTRVRFASKGTKRTY